MTVAITNLKDLIQPGYDPEWGNPRFLDSEGQPVAGIYADVENDDYHAIPALSSSKLKKFYWFKEQVLTGLHLIISVWYSFLQKMNYVKQ